MTKTMPSLDATLLRIADALERLTPPQPAAPDFNIADAFIWHMPIRLTPTNDESY
jgi:hypothetical protein